MATVFGRGMPLLAALAMTATLVACTPGGISSGVSPSGSSSASNASDAPSATPTPSTADTTPPLVNGPLTLPLCEGLLSISDARAFFGAGTEVITPGVTAAEVMQGPVAVATVAEATQTRVCTWGIPNSDGGFNVVAAEVPLASAASLITALRSAGTFSESTASGVTLFTREFDSEIGSFSVSYAFIGTAWVTVAGSLSADGARDLAETVMVSVRAANPTQL